MTGANRNGLCRAGLHDWEANKRFTGGQWRCDPCKRSKQRKWAINRPTPEPTPERRERARAASAESRRKYPEKSRARNAVQRAIKRGDLIRPDTCFQCGNACKPEASHDDYDKPLEVEWLCRPCHAKKDRGIHVRLPK